MSAILMFVGPESNLQLYCEFCVCLLYNEDKKYCVLLKHYYLYLLLSNYNNSYHQTSRSFSPLPLTCQYLRCDGWSCDGGAGGGS